ncbi:hypothetical protein MBU64_002041 [Enterococcus faecalis]|nr:hypothetical protein [Enterococcus faecalis]
MMNLMFNNARALTYLDISSFDLYTICYYLVGIGKGLKS